MPSFDYKAKDKAGNTVTGVVEAPTAGQAAGKIREMGQLPMSITPSRAEHAQSAVDARAVVRKRVIDPIWTGVNIRALAFFYRQLATLLASGMSLSEALQSIQTRSRGRLKRIILEALARVRQGDRLSETMREHERVFGKLQISLVQTGEAGGLLDTMFTRIADYLDHEISIRRMMTKMLFYPFIIFIAIIVIPKAPALVMDGFGPFAKALWADNSVWLFYAVLALIVLKFLLQFEAARLVWDMVKIQPPILGTMARKVAMSRFSRALALLFSSGMSMSESVRLSADASANVATGRSIKTAIPAIQDGQPLTESLTRTGMVMPMVLDMLATGEKTGSMDLVLEKVADYMDDEVDVTIHKTGILLFVLTILVAGWIVLRMMMSFYVGQANETLHKGGL